MLLLQLNNKTLQGWIYMTQFRDWLAGELERRDWSAAELSRRAGINASTISRILDDEQPRSVGIEAAQKIAVALDEAPEKVFILAGLLPAPPDEDDPILRDINHLARRLPAPERKEVLDYIRFKAVNRSDVITCTA